MRLNRSWFTAVLFTTLAACAGCGDSSDLVDDGKAVSEVEIGPDIQSLTKGSTMQFRLSVAYADGTTKDVTEDEDTVWNTSDPEVATVLETGMVTAVEVGVVTISGDYKGETADEDFAVMP